jgi:hypothetical protein
MIGDVKVGDSIYNEDEEQADAFFQHPHGAGRESSSSCLSQEAENLPSDEEDHQ